MNHSSRKHSTSEDNETSISSTSDLYSFQERSVQEFTDRRDYVWAMREDIASWLVNVVAVDDCVTAENLFQKLASGEILCKHANTIYQASSVQDGTSSRCKQMSTVKIVSGIRFSSKVNMASSHGKFIARDNLVKFLNWCAEQLRIQKILLFESNDLIEEIAESPGERNVVCTLIEIIRRGGWYGIEVSDFLKLEEELIQEQLIETEEEVVIDEDVEKLKTTSSVEIISEKEPEITKAISSEETVSNEVENEIVSEKTTDRTQIHKDKTIIIEKTTKKSSNTPESSRVNMPSKKRKSRPHEIINLDSGVKCAMQTCTCPDKFELNKIGEGKYRLGESDTVLFLRILRSHILVRVGGGWDTFENWLVKHDPCRGNRSRLNLKLNVQSGFKKCRPKIRKVALVEIFLKMTKSHRNHQKSLFINCESYKNFILKPFLTNNEQVPEQTNTKIKTSTTSINLNTKINYIKPKFNNTTIAAAAIGSNKNFGNNSSYPFKNTTNKFKISCFNIQQSNKTKQQQSRKKITS